MARLTPASIRAATAAALQVFLAAAVLLWPLAVAGRPTVFFDTGQYWWSGRIVVVQGLGLDRGAPTPFDQSPDGEVVVNGVAESAKTLSTFVGARSPTYGTFVFATQQLGTLWLTAALQALATALLLRLIWRLALPKAAGWRFLALVTALSLLTSLAFFASFAMSDVFAGLAVLVMIALTVYRDRLGSLRRGVLLGALLLFLTFHVSHLLLAVLLAPATAVVLRRRGVTRRGDWSPFLSLGAVIGVAALFTLAAAPGLRALSGVDVRSPPFLTARLLADGPGRTYLRRVCAGASPFALCRFKDRPLDDSDDILWSDTAPKGVFGVAGPDERLRLEAEQGRFVRAVVLADPVGVTLAVARSVGRQLVLFGVDEPLRDPCWMTPRWTWSQGYLRVLVVNPERCVIRDRPLAPGNLFNAVQGVVLILSAYGLWRLARSRRALVGAAREPPDDLDRLLTAAALVVIAIVLNALICGGLSGPFPRYEARLIWLLPAMAMLAGLPSLTPGRIAGAHTRRSDLSSAEGGQRLGAEV